MSFGRTIPILRMFDAAKARDQPWGTREVCVTDPFGNKLTFSSPVRA
jgi:uncharacterized glyoxalase superfamily protein PhnB